MSEYWQWIEAGGVMLVAIVLTSLVGVTLFVARLNSYRRQRVLPVDVQEEVLKAAKAQDWQGAQAHLKQDRSALGRVYAEGLRFRGASRRDLKEAMEEVGIREMTRLERYVGGIGAAASVAPLMGLLGTVLGMIRVFQSVVSEASVHGVADPTVLAEGIWEALITTAAGLFVGIPLYLGYRYLIGKWESLAVDLEDAASRLLDILAPPLLAEQGESASALAVEGETKTEEQSAALSEVLTAEGA